MKIKSFECPNSIRNYEKNIFGTSNAWLTRRLSHRPSQPGYYIVDCWISRSENEKFPSEVPYLLVFPDAQFLNYSSGYWS